MAVPGGSEGAAGPVRTELAVGVLRQLLCPLRPEHAGRRPTVARAAAPTRGMDPEERIEVVAGRGIHVVDLVGPEVGSAAQRLRRRCVVRRTESATGRIAQDRVALADYAAGRNERSAAVLGRVDHVVRAVPGQLG